MVSVPLYPRIRHRARFILDTGKYPAENEDRMSNELLNKDIYQPSFASRLTGIAASTIKRWLPGYKRQSVDHTQAESKLLLSFLDLIEIQFLQAFRRCGVQWSTIREAAEKARDLLGAGHPFSTKRFSTNGKNILGTISENLDNDSSRLESPDIVEPVLRDFIDCIDYFEGCDSACRWWPRGKESSVMLDPRIAFGRPVVGDKHVPTDVIKDTFKTTGSISKVSSWYRITEDMVRETIKYEESIAT